VVDEAVAARSAGAADGSCDRLLEGGILPASELPRQPAAMPFTAQASAA
jgi:hypothetical protein